jgi:hypothetical protein
MTIYTVHDSYLGMVEEATYATAVAPARFFEIENETIAGKYSRIDAKGVRAGTRVLRTDRWAPNFKGADGTVKLEVQDSNFGLLFKHALGALSAGAPVGGFTPYTFTIGTLTGLSSTWQVGRYATDGSLTPFTYAGGKIHNWELTSAVDGVLGMSLGLDFATETQPAGTGAFALAIPTYPSGSQLFTYIGGTATVGGTAFAVHDVAVKGDNKLKVDRFFMANNNVKKEPLEQEMRTVNWELKGEFDGLTQFNRVSSVTAAGATAAIVMNWATPQGGALTVTIPNARFDAGPPHVDGAKVPEISFTGMALDDGISPPISIVYKTKDAAP